MTEKTGIGMVFLQGKYGEFPMFWNMEKIFLEVLSFVLKASQKWDQDILVSSIAFVIAVQRELLVLCASAGCW